MADQETPRKDRWSELEDRADDRLYREADRFERAPVRSGFGWFVKFCLGLGALMIVGAVIFGTVSLITSWGGETKRIVGPENSRAQTTAVIGDYKELEATAGNVCDAKNSKSDADSPTLVEDPAFAYRATYRRIKADYDRRMSNFFEAAVTRNLPIPSALRGYPREAPTLAEMTAQIC